MKKIAALLSILCSTGFGRVIEIEKPVGKKEVITDQGRLAKKNFLNLMNCQKYIRPEVDEAKLKNCISQFVHPSSTDAHLRKYVQFFMMIAKISEPFLCDSDTLDMAKSLHPASKTILCLSIIGTRAQIPVVLLFENAGSVPMMKLLKY